MPTVSIELEQYDSSVEAVATVSIYTNMVPNKILFSYPSSNRPKF